MRDSYMIKPDEISVVVQGEIERDATPKCLKSIRRFLPGAEIVLSTWEGRSCEGLDYDILVLNVDPGPSDLIRQYPFEQVNNCNRQIVSTKNGINKSSKKYVLKIRTDMLLSGRGFLDYYEISGATTTEESIFTQRIMVCANLSHFNVFVMCDWWTFGLKQDSLLLWDIPLYPDKKGEEYFLKQGNEKKKAFGKDVVCRFFPEIWIPYQCLRKFSPLVIEHAFVRSRKIMSEASKFLKDNFVTIEYNFSNLRLLKYENKIRATIPKNYTNYKLQIKYINDTWGKLTIPFIKRLGYKLRCKATSRVADLSYIYSIRNYAKPDDLVVIQNKKLYYKDISFIISAPINEDLRRYALLIGKAYPGAKILIITSQKTDVELYAGFSLIDRVIYVPERDEYYDDTFCDFDGKIRFTYNRRQNEFWYGLQATETAYAACLTPDCHIWELDLVKVYNRLTKTYQKTLQKYRLFRQKVLIVPPTESHRSKTKIGEIPAKYAFGLTRDLQKLYNGRFMDASCVNFFSDNKSLLKNPDRLRGRFSHEQFLYLSLLKETHKNFDLPESYHEWTTNQALKFEKYFANNFVVNSKGTGGGKDSSLYLREYMINVDPQNTDLDRLFLIEKGKASISKCIAEFNVDLSNCFSPIKEVFTWITEPFAASFYGLKLLGNRFRLLFEGLCGHLTNLRFRNGKY